MRQIRMLGGLALGPIKLISVEKLYFRIRKGDLGWIFYVI